MHKDAAKELVLKHLNTDEQFVDVFQTMYTPSFYWFFLIGPFLYLGARQYFVGVTDHGLHFHKLNFFGKPDQHDYFSFGEITAFRYSTGIFQYPLEFVFENGRSLKIKAQRKGVEKIAKITDETLSFLQKHIGG